MMSKTEKRTEQVLEFQMTPELKAVIDQCNAIKPLSPYLFKTRKGEPYLKPDKSAEGFTSIWQRWQNKMPEDKQFLERSIRNWDGDQDDLQTASGQTYHSNYRIIFPAFHLVASKSNITFKKLIKQLA